MRITWHVPTYFGECATREVVGQPPCDMCTPWEQWYSCGDSTLVDYISFLLNVVHSLLLGSLTYLRERKYGCHEAPNHWNLNLNNKQLMQSCWICMFLEVHKASEFSIMLPHCFDGILSLAIRPQGFLQFLHSK